jgi:DNA-binding NtrC family response regulator
MVYGFARQSGGTVVARSEVGKGSTITLYLPLGAHAPRHDGEDGAAATTGGAGQAVLIVDDEPLVREHAGMVSAALGYAPTVAETAEEALALLRAGRRFDLLFTGIALPGPLDGPALAAAATAIEPSMRVVFASDHLDAIMPREDMPAGGAVLAKPYGVDALARAFEAALRTADPTRSCDRARPMERE